MRTSGEGLARLRNPPPPPPLLLLLLLGLLVAPACGSGGGALSGGPYRSVAPEELGNGARGVVVTLEFGPDGGVARPALGAALTLSEFGAGLAWRVAAYDAAAPNILRLVTADGEAHDLGEDARSPYGGKWQRAVEVEEEEGGGGGSGGSGGGQCAEQDGGPGCTDAPAKATATATAKTGSQLSVRAREQRLAAVHASIASTSSAFEAGISPDGSYRFRFTSKVLVTSAFSYFYFTRDSLLPTRFFRSLTSLLT